MLLPKIRFLNVIQLKQSLELRVMIKHQTKHSDGSVQHLVSITAQSIDQPTGQE